MKKLRLNKASINYVDCCTTYEVLLQDSGLLPKPRADWNVFVPELDMIAHVDKDNSDYRFDGSTWVKIVESDESDATLEVTTNE